MKVMLNSTTLDNKQTFSNWTSQSLSLFSLETQAFNLLSKVPFSSFGNLLHLESGSEGTARDGCGNDAFEVFGFLAFGLYLLNLVMNMDGRKKRSADHCSYHFNPTHDPKLMEGVLAVYSMFQGFLNALHAGEGNCYEAKM